jgi:hypothetical protein
MLLAVAAAAAVAAAVEQQQQRRLQLIVDQSIQRTLPTLVQAVAAVRRNYVAMPTLPLPDHVRNVVVMPTLLLLLLLLMLLMMMRKKKMKKSIHCLI